MSSGMAIQTLHHAGHSRLQFWKGHSAVEARSAQYAVYRRNRRIEAAANTKASDTTTTGGSVSTPTGMVGMGDREYLSLFPPFFMRTTTFQEFQPGLYGLTQPLAINPESGGFDVKLRMTVAKLGDGSLLLVGPVAPTEEMLSMLWAIEGEVKHIILPNTSPEHWYFAPALAAKFPRATVWTVPGFWEGKGAPFPPLGLRQMRETSPCKVLGVDQLPPELEGEVESVLFTVFWFIEAAIVLPRYRTLLLADTALILDPEEYAGAGERLVESAKKSGVWGRLGPSITKSAFERKPDVGRQWVEAVLQHDFDTVVVGHASAPASSGKEAFQECFNFLY